MLLPKTPFAPVPVLFLDAPTDSDLLQFLQEADRLAQACPDVVAAVDADLDAHGLRKKALRIADRAWVAARTKTLPGIASVASVIDAGRLRLGHGRRRTPGFVVLMAILLRGYFGRGFKSCDAFTLMQESVTLRVFFANLGISMPKASTLTELANAVTNATRLRILDAQVARVLHLGWDDFKVLLQDSTHVEGNTAWPTDSRLLVALVSRLSRIGAALPHFELPPAAPPNVSRHLTVMKALHREIDITKGTREGARMRRRRYAKLLRHAGRAHKAFAKAISQVEAALVELDALPSRRAMAERAVGHLRGDIDALERVIKNCEARVLHEVKVPMAEKELSVSDPDVGFIAKGQREPVIGYKPQVARSGEGFITGLLLPKGNAPDAMQLRPMVDEVIRRTTIVPEVVSVDDGYASASNKEAMDKLKIGVISINGSKGRALTAHADWESEAYAEARSQRSAIESLMFTLKQGFDFGVVARRGLSAAYGELLEKALAYNVCHMVRVRRRRVSEVEEDCERALSLVA